MKMVTMFALHAMLNSIGIGLCISRGQVVASAGCFLVYQQRNSHPQCAFTGMCGLCVCRYR